MAEDGYGYGQGLSADGDGEGDKRGNWVDDKIEGAVIEHYNKDKHSTMKVILQASVPTIYQLNSLREFGLPYKAALGGSYYFSEEFESVEKAKEYLRKRAIMYADDTELLEEMYQDIELGYLQLDAATAHIVVL